MKIKNIKINSYGTLKQKEINLKNKINIIYGKNESGKSTLLNFIKNIFYGISKNKNGKEISDYEKYLPWVGEEFSGKIGYELNNGNYFEIYRDFHKKNPKVFDANLEEISNNFKIDKKDGNQFFFEQTGVSEQTYVSTIMSAQQEVVLDKQSQNILVQKLANLAGTGDDKVSFQKAMDKLNKRQLEEVGTSRTQDRPLNVVQNRMKTIEFDLKDEKMHLENAEHLQEQKQEIEQEILQEKNKNNIIQKLINLKQEKNIEKEKINLKNKIKNENEEKIEKILKEKNELLKNNLEEEKNNFNNLENNSQKIANKNINLKNKLNKKIKRNYSLFLIIFILLIILNIFNFIFIKNEIINYSILSLIPIELILFIIYFIKNKKIKNKIENEILEEKQQEKELQEQIAVLDAQINFIQNEIEKQQKEMEQEKLQLDLKIEQEKQKIHEKYDSENNFNDLFLKESNNLEELLQNSNQKILESQLQLNKIEYEESHISEQIEKITTLKEEYAELQEQQEELEEKNKCLQATKQLLEKAYEKMKNTITPKFTQNLSNMVQKISNGKYQKVSIHEDKGLIVELENGEYIPASLLSIGTIDQLYLSLRLSMLDEISEEKMPIILDEAFAYFDDERLKNSLLFLEQKSEEYQIILFTCTKREKKILEEANIEYEWIEI